MEPWTWARSSLGPILEDHRSAFRRTCPRCRGGLRPFKAALTVKQTMTTLPPAASTAPPGTRVSPVAATGPASAAVVAPRGTNRSTARGRPCPRPSPAIPWSSPRGGRAPGATGRTDSLVCWQQPGRTPRVVPLHPTRNMESSNAAQPGMPRLLGRALMGALGEAAPGGCLASERRGASRRRPNSFMVGVPGQAGYALPGPPVWLPFVRAQRYLNSRQSLLDYSLTQSTARPSATALPSERERTLSQVGRSCP